MFLLPRRKMSFVGLSTIFVLLGFIYVISLRQASGGLCNSTTFNTTYVCEHGVSNQLHLLCEDGELISVISALYGRRNNTICPPSPSNPVHCESKKSLSFMREKCEGRSTCLVTANNYGFGDPCPGIEKYLEVQYTCYRPATRDGQRNSPKCPDGGWYFRDRCYWLIKVPTRKWADANSYCSRTGTDLQLAVLQDNETNAFLERMMCETGVPTVWIGLSNLQDQVHFRWVDGSFVNKTNAKWGPHEPRKVYGSDCVYAGLYPEIHWSTASCSDTRKAFVCSQIYEPTVCPNGGTFFRDRCYWLGEGTRQWHEADQACRDEFGKHVRLPVVRDADVNSFLRKFTHIGEMWLGLHDIVEESSWVWVDGTAVTYSQWGYGEPNDIRGEDCAVMIPSGFWNDATCHLYFHYICALPPCIDRMFEDEGSGAGDPGNFTDSTCSTTCTCVTGAACFHDGSCKCLPEFKGMVCDKANFNMTVSLSSPATLGGNVTLTCQVNIPIHDVRFQWSKTTGNKRTKRLHGHEHAHRGTSEVTLRDINKDNLGVYLCLTTYSTGSSTVVTMKSIEVTIKGDATVMEEPPMQGAEGPSYQGMLAGTIVLAVTCLALIVIFITLKRRKRYA